MSLVAIDLFSGCGGLTEGMHQAGFTTKLAFEINDVASRVYEANHKTTHIIRSDVRNVSIKDVKSKLGNQTIIHLLAGCPPCQGFSSVRRLNKISPIDDPRNSLILEYVRFVKELKPYTIMMENVPGLLNYELFHQAVETLRKIGYFVDYNVVNVKNYGIPQSRKRLVLVGSRLGEIKIAPETNHRTTVRDVIGNLVPPHLSDDKLHQVVAKHCERIQRQIELTPKNGGSRKDLPDEYQLACHKKESVGFHDVYGRLRWDDYSTTITGGCLNPSKGRFLHPEQDRCITAREASLLQSFPIDYDFLPDISKNELALMIGNALPPKFSYFQSKNIKDHLVIYGINPN